MSCVAGSLLSSINSRVLMFQRRGGAARQWKWISHKNVNWGSLICSSPGSASVLSSSSWYQCNTPPNYCTIDLVHTTGRPNYKCEVFVYQVWSSIQVRKWPKISLSNNTFSYQQSWTRSSFIFKIIIKL